MKKKLFLSVIIASALISSCTKTDDKDTKTPTPSTEATLDSTEQKLLGKWIVEKHTDSSVTIIDGAPDPNPFVFNLDTTGRYLEFKKTRTNFLVGSDLKNKDLTDALYNVPASQYWWYDAASKILYLNPDDYEILYLSDSKLVIRFVTADNTSGNTRRYRAIVSYLRKE